MPTVARQEALPERKLTYQQEQAALLARHEGREIRIEVPKEPEVNPEVYRDVVPLLFRGFVTMPAQIGEAIFVFKSLNQHEFDLIKLMGPIEKTNSYKYWDILLSYNVFMIDGQNVLADRERWLPKIIDMFSEMDLKPKERIIRYVSEINRRANSAVILTESYAMESYSRYRWAQLSGIDLCSPTATGTPGSERLGMNWAQLTWRAINYYEDRHEQSERDWENAKFVGSCMAGKGLSKVYQQDNDRRQKEKAEKTARKDKILRQVLLGEKQVVEGRTLHGAVLTGAHTVEELANQLEKDLKGEKDLHDQVVEEHTNRIRRNIQGRQDQVKELVKKHDDEFDGRRVLGGTTYGKEDFKGLSVQEVQERITRSKQIEAQRASQRMVRPELVVTDPKAMEFMNKWGITEDNPTAIPVEKTDWDVSSAVPIVPPRQGGKPFGRR